MRTPVVAVYLPSVRPLTHRPHRTPRRRRRACVQLVIQVGLWFGSGEPNLVQLSVAMVNYMAFSIVTSYMIEKEMRKQFVLRRVAFEKGRILRGIEKQAQALLLNILPAHIAERLLARDVVQVGHNKVVPGYQGKGGGVFRWRASTVCCQPRACLPSFLGPRSHDLRSFGRPLTRRCTMTSRFWRRTWWDSPPCRPSSRRWNWFASSTKFSPVRGRGTALIVAWWVI